MSLAAAVHKKATELSKLSLRMTAHSGSGHPSSAISLSHLITYLMYHQMKFNPGDPWNLASDRLVLSEGHAVPIVYAAWADLGGAVCEPDGGTRALTIKDLDELRARDSVLDGHPNPAEGFPFFDAATGSLGQGLSVAAGLAWAARQSDSPRRVYCLIGDGEAREGQIWEAVDFIADHGLTNVCAIFNCNGHGQAAPVSSQQSPERLAQKLEAYGYTVAVIDGHDPIEIARAMTEFDQCHQRPLAVIAKTVKGWGVKTLLEGNWHGKPLKSDQLDEAEKSLDAARAAAVENLTGGGRLEGPSWPAEIRAFELPDTKSVRWPGFAEALEGAGLGDALAKGKLATRRAYGAALKTAGDLLPHVVALDGDVSNSTFSNMFAKAHPDRFIEGKIAEQNLVSAAAGLSAAGRMPFVNSFAKFIARAYDQVEMANISRANIKLVGSHAGISLAADGPSQMSLLDIAYFGALATVRDETGQPICRLYQPADAVAAYHCTRLMTQVHGMCYMRTHRPDVPLLYDPDAEFGPDGFHVLREGDRVAVVASGYMVHVALEAAETLARAGVSTAVVDVFCLPFDAKRLIDALEDRGAKALVVEDNYGGLAEAVALAAADRGDIRVSGLGCRRIPKSTRTVEDILDYCGVGVSQIVKQTQNLCEA